jgi:hypothetical protein
VSNEPIERARAAGAVGEFAASNPGEAKIVIELEPVGCAPFGPALAGVAAAAAPPVIGAAAVRDPAAVAQGVTTAETEPWLAVPVGAAPTGAAACHATGAGGGTAGAAGVAPWTIPGPKFRP